MSVKDFHSTVHQKRTGANAINISGLLVLESRLLTPKKLGNLKNQINAIKIRSLDTHFLEIWEPSVRSYK